MHFFLITLCLRILSINGVEGYNQFKMIEKQVIIQTRGTELDLGIEIQKVKHEVTYDYVGCYTLRRNLRLDFNLSVPSTDKICNSNIFKKISPSKF